MFEDALLESSPLRTPILRRTHYLLSALAGALVFVQGLYLLPALLVFPETRALFITSAIVGTVASGYALMLFYVWADTKQRRLPTWPLLCVAVLLNVLGFLAYLAYAAAKSGDWKRAATSLAYVAEALVVGVLVLVPLIYTQALPRQMLITDLHIAPPRGRPPVPKTENRVSSAPHHSIDLLHSRIKIPDHLVQIVDNTPPPEVGSDSGLVVTGGIPDGQSDKVLGEVIGGASWGKEQPPPPPVAHAAPKQTMVRRGGNVMQAQALYQPKPGYPPLALAARIQGTVLLQAIIGKDGSVQDLKVVSGHPLLISAALEAVRAWRYQPTLLNGEPVDVLTEISVNFTLSE
jgi:protein TonB